MRILIVLACSLALVMVASANGSTEQTTVLRTHQDNSELDGSDWDLYGSILRLAIDGRTLQFTVVQPDHYLKLAAVRAGSVLIEADMHGSSLRGTAYMFDRRCGSYLYQVDGLIDLFSTRIVLNGQAPLLDQSCNVFGYRFDRLELIKYPERL